MSTNPRLRESPPSTADASDAPTSYKGTGPEERANATKVKNAGREPCQEIARQPENREPIYTTRSHKSIPTGLPDSTERRTDSREEMYDVLAAWEGMSHE